MNLENDPTASTPSSPCREIPLTLRVSGWSVPAALTLPLSASDYVTSAILLIPGSLFCDVDGDFPAWGSYPHVYAHLARQLSARGHAVYRFAKLGPGTGSIAEDPDPAATVRDWDGRVTIARAALVALVVALAEAHIVADRIVVAGHSEGSVVASRLLAECASDSADVAGLVLLSGPSIGILGIMREQLPLFTAPDQLNEAVANLNEAIELIMRGEPIPPELGARPGVQGLYGTGPVGWSYLSDCERTNPAEVASRVRQPTLVVQGGRDMSVGAHHADALVAARDGQATRKLVFPELSHMYKEVPAGSDASADFGYPGETDLRVADGIDEWIRSGIAI
jgi:uncharacterized protein